MNPINPYTQRERGPSPGLTLLRTLGRAAKRCRPGFGTKEALILAAVAAAVVVVLGGSFLLFRAIFGGSEEQVLKSNIDRVAQKADVYWNEFAADRHGRRNIDLGEFCDYANAEFAVGEDLILRTLGVRDSTDLTTTDLTSDTAEAANSAAEGDADHVALRTDLASTDISASCPTITGTDPGGHTVVGLDMIVSENTIAAASLPGGFQTASPIQADELISAGLSSTNSVWLAQHVGSTVPAGARSTGNTENDVLFFGGVAPSGRSFCLIKVFNASDRGAIGEYRVARDASTGDETPFAVCSEGIDTPNVRINAGWPATN